MFSYFRRAFSLIWADKLSSSIYACGTAVAIASAMVVALILHIRIADIYPEVNRSRTAYVHSTLQDAEGRYLGGGFSPLAVEEMFSHLQCAEVVSASMPGDYIYEFTACAELGRQEVPVSMKFTDDNFFRLYRFRFTAGRPYSEDELRGAERCVVITDALARKVFGTTEGVVGRQLLLNFLPYRVEGIIEEVSALVSESSADVYLPYTVSDSRFRFGNEKVSYAGALWVRVLLKKGCTVRMLKDELEAYKAKYLSMLKQSTGEDYTWNLAVEPHWASVLQFFSYSDNPTSDLLLNFSLPALIMLLLLLLPALNLGGLVSNRMEARVAEMGIRKAFGAKRRTLLLQVVHENLVLTLIGGMAGYLLAWMFIGLVRESGVFLTFFEREYDPVTDVTLQADMFLTPMLFLIAFVCCALLNLMAALIPAWQSLRKPIVESLKQKQ